MPLSRPSGEATSGLRAWCITLIVAASTPRSATLSGSVKSVPSPRSALRVIPTTTPWLKRPSDCSKLNCWTSARSPGVDWRAWSSPSSATSTGSTPVASTIRSAAFHQQSSKQPTTTNTMNAANYNWTEPIDRASDKPGEIQVAGEQPRGEGPFSVLGDKQLEGTDSGSQGPSLVAVTLPSAVFGSLVGCCSYVLGHLGLQELLHHLSTISRRKPGSS